MAKTKQQLEKRKREFDKRKKIEKAVLKIAAEMTAKENEQALSVSANDVEAARTKA